MYCIERNFPGIGEKYDFRGQNWSQRVQIGNSQLYNYDSIIRQCLPGKKVYISAVYSALWSSLVPRSGEGGGERAPGTHCLWMHLIATEFRGDHVRMCTYVYWWRHKLTALICQFMRSWCSVRVTLYRSVLCLLVAGYLKIKLKKEQVASNERVYWGNMPLCQATLLSCSRDRIASPTSGTFHA